MDVKVYRMKNSRINHLGGFVVQASKHIKTLILFCILIIGMISGNFLLKINDNSYLLVKDIFDEYTLTLSENTMFQHFISQCTINMSILLIYFIFGLCAIGFPMPVIITLIKGISIGALGTFMYSQYTLKGFVFCILVLYPIQIVLSLINLRAGKESFTMSKTIFKTLTEQKLKNSENNYLKSYLLNYLILGAVTLLISFISALSAKYIIPMFNFN